MFKISEKCHIFIALRLGKGYCLNLESFASTISILSQYHNLISINTMVSLFTLFVLINVVSCLYGETSTAIGSTSLTEYWKRLFNVVSNNVRKSPGNIAASSVTTLIQGDPKLASTLNEHSSFLGKETPGITPILQEEKLQGKDMYSNS